MVSAILTIICALDTDRNVKTKPIMKNVIQTLFLRIISDALSRDWMQADKASWDKPWKTALCKRNNVATGPKGIWLKEN